MHTQTTETFRHVTDEKSATLSRSGWTRNRIRTIAFWATTAVVVSELTAGSVWNLPPIEWTRSQLGHLGYPLYYAYITGVWQILGAAAIIAPRFPRLKEWAYAGAFFTWSGAVASHLLRGDYTPVSTWVTPLFFATCGIASWALRPADRRLPNEELAPETRPLAWAVPIGIVLVLVVLWYLTLPVVNVWLHERAVELGWIPR